jgi:hypothetical protein
MILPAGPAGEAVHGSTKSLKNLKSKMSPHKWTNDSTALMPVKENPANLRALKELEAIKIKKRRTEEQKLAKEMQI